MQENAQLIENMVEEGWKQEEIIKVLEDGPDIND